MTSTSFKVEEKLCSGLGNRFGIFISKHARPFTIFCFAALCCFVGNKALAEPLSLPRVHEPPKYFELVLSDRFKHRLRIFNFAFDKRENLVPLLVELFPLVLPDIKTMPDIRTSEKTDDAEKPVENIVISKMLKEFFHEYEPYIWLNATLFLLGFLIIARW